MNVLVFNCGSSSLKYKLLSMPSCLELAGGEAQRVGPPTAKPSCIFHRADGGEKEYQVAMPDHATAFEEVMKILKDEQGVEVHAIGHRLVHGGTKFKHHTLVDESIWEDLDSTRELAPLHNPPAIDLVRACQERYPDLPAVLVFDTAFHSTIPDYAGTYALPRWVREDMGIRKYGFHGTSHNFVAVEAAKLLGKPLEDLNAVSCHLGSGGASLCAIVKGKSVDNTMGYSPLQGLMMSTRCGDLDSAAVMRLLYQHAGDHQAVEDLLNKKSGVLGMYGSTADIRDVMEKSSAVESGEGVKSARGEQGETQEMTATLDVYLWRIKKYLGAYLTAVAAGAGKPADAVIFTDTIGETVDLARRVICTGMEVFGLKIDPKRNMNPEKLPADVSADDSRVRALVIQTNEELAIARQTYAIISGGRDKVSAAGGAA